MFPRRIQSAILNDSISMRSSSVSLEIPRAFPSYGPQRRRPFEFTNQRLSRRANRSRSKSPLSESRARSSAERQTGARRLSRDDANRDGPRVRRSSGKVDDARLDCAQGCAASSAASSAELNRGVVVAAARTCLHGPRCLGVYSDLPRLRRLAASHQHRQAKPFARRREQRRRL